MEIATPAGNTRDPAKVCMGYTPDSQWRNRAEFFTGREAIKEFLTRKWQKEHDYRLKKELWCWQGDRISVTFQYEYHNAEGQWFRAHGNEQWEFNSEGLMQRRDCSINDVAIQETERRFRWERT